MRQRALCRECGAPIIPAQPACIECRAPLEVQAVGKDPFNDPDIVRKAVAVLARKAARSRRFPSDFFEFVIKEETTRAPILVTPHQKLLLDFVEAHDRAVLMLPVGHTKTFSMAALCMFFLGLDPTMRGAIVSASQGQAEKPLAMVRNYIESSPELRLVFPHLVPSMRKGDPWTQTAITVDRPPGIRDPSLIAVGIDGAIEGSRLNWIIVDDILDRENTATKDQREKVYDWLSSSVRSRLDPQGARIVVTNTAWHPEDAVHIMRDRVKWPTMRMDIYGDIEFYNTEFDSDLIRPRDPRSQICRLVAHDPDPRNLVPLWVERYATIKEIEALAREFLPQRFNQLFRNICRSDETAKVKTEWIEECKRRARVSEVFSLTSSYNGPNATFTGVDLAVKAGDERDETAFVTIEILHNGMRRILDIELGQFDGPTIVRKLAEKQKAYNSIVRVEDNGAQDFIRQFALAENISIPVKTHTTGANKYYDIEKLIVQVYNGAWLIPNDKHHDMDPSTKALVDALLYYSPAKHTPDVLMAMMFANEQALEFGLIPNISGNNPNTEGGGGSFGANIMAR